LFFLPILGNDFIFSDDPNFITENPHIRSFDWASLQWMWTTWHTGNWIPLTWLSLALDFQLGGLSPRIFHFTNLMIHVFNTVMVFFLCRGILNLANANMTFPPKTDPKIWKLWKQNLGGKNGKETVCV
jgi:protein O-mannosyl-transferase